MNNFNLRKLFHDVFLPESGEIVTIMTDIPHAHLPDNDNWVERRQMAMEWHDILDCMGDEMGFQVNPLLLYPATGASHAPLPQEGKMGDTTVDVLETVNESTIVLAFGEFSATGPLAAATRETSDLRVATLPLVERRMEKTSLSVDYSVVRQRAEVLAALLTPAVGATLTFETGHTIYFDLRYRTGRAEAGYLPRDKQQPRFINLPSGEAYSAPYESERHGEHSKTEGTLPVDYDGERALFHVVRNSIQRVEGEGPKAIEMANFFAVDPARANIAELGLGVNLGAKVTGNVLEDEKAIGVHWAYGRSDTLGGVIGPHNFKSPANVIHTDIVYAVGSPIQADTLILHGSDKIDKLVYADGNWTVF
jgi:leucyl aminopeptidase (aminopeptidase T)